MQANLLVLIAIPFISGFIGWLTNFFAVKMLFHPREKKKFLFSSLQGIIPANQRRIAERLSTTISTSLLSTEDLKTKVIENQDLDKVVLDEIDGYLDEFLRNKLDKIIPMAAMFISDDLINKAKGLLLKDLANKIPGIKASMVEKGLEKLDLKSMIHQKILELSLEDLELVLMGILKKEFRFVEIIGGVVGFVIGLFQVLIFWL